MSLFNTIYYSAVGDPEDLSAADAGNIEVVEYGGPITGLATLGDLFFVIWFYLFLQDLLVVLVSLLNDKVGIYCLVLLHVLLDSFEFVYHTQE